VYVYVRGEATKAVSAARWFYQDILRPVLLQHHNYSSPAPHALSVTCMCRQVAEIAVHPPICSVYTDENTDMRYRQVAEAAGHRELSKILITWAARED